MTIRPQNRFSFALIAVFSLGLLAASPSAEAKGDYLTDFSETAVTLIWVSVNDSVMGGVSDGRASATSDNTLKFSGTLSLENNGGFASIRTRAMDLDIQDDDTLVVRFKGDGRTYYMDLRTAERRMASNYRTPIQTEAGKWKEVRVELSDFYFTSFGRKIDRAPIKGSAVNSFGFTLADKKAGPFELEIAWVKAERAGEGGEVVVANAGGTAKGKAAPAVLSDIVDTASNAGQFKILLAAAEAAGLVEALKNPDAKLTVFAPTDEAFAALPAGTVQSLLLPANRDRLVAVLKHHVLASEVRLGGSVQTLNGDALDIKPAGSIKVGDATVIAANVQASNGIIHVIDRVLIPEMPELTETQKAMRMIELAIDRGVPQYNAGRPSACVALYELAAMSLLSGHSDALTEADTKLLNKALSTLAGDHSVSDQAWALRGALDKVYESLSASK